MRSHLFTYLRKKKLSTEKKALATAWKLNRFKRRGNATPKLPGINQQHQAINVTDRSIIWNEWGRTTEDTQSTGLEDVLMYDWCGVEESEGWAQGVADNWNERR